MPAGKSRVRSPLRSTTVRSAASIAILAACLTWASPLATATSDYSQTLRTPCTSCHPSATSPDLNPRGQVFAAIESHRSDPASAWSQTLETHPLEAGSAMSVWAPAALVVIGVLGALVVSRRRRLSAPSR